MSSWLIPVIAILGSLICVTAVYLDSRWNGREDVGRKTLSFDRAAGRTVRRYHIELPEFDQRKLDDLPDAEREERVNDRTEAFIGAAAMLTSHAMEDIAYLDQLRRRFSGNDPRLDDYLASIEAEGSQQIRDVLRASLERLAAIQVATQGPEV